MIRVGIVSALFVLWLVLPALAQDTVDGTVRHPDGTFEYTKVTLVNTYTDDFFTYWLGQSKGIAGNLVFDPYNRIWVAYPISYSRTTLPFGGKQIEGWKRTYGDGTEDKRFFFGVDGHVYMKVDKYRKRRMQNGRRRRHHVYSFWMDLATGRRGDVLIDESGEAPPSTDELAADAQQAAPADAFTNWKQASGAADISQEPLSEDEQMSLGALIDQEVSGDSAQGS